MTEEQQQVTPPHHIHPSANLTRIAAWHEEARTNARMLSKNASRARGRCCGLARLAVNVERLGMVHSEYWSAEVLRLRNEAAEIFQRTDGDSLENQELQEYLCGEADGIQYVLNEIERNG